MQRATRIPFKLVVVLALVAALIGSSPPQFAFAVPGDRIAEVITIEGRGPTWARGISVSVGFDGQHLYYTEYGGSVLHRVNVPPAGDPTPAAGQVDFVITGVPSGVMNIAYDRGRDLFWATTSDGLSVYTITKTGSGKLQFTIDPSTDRPGYREGVEEVKIAYDGADDTLWLNPDASTRVYHYHTTADALGTAQLVTATPFIDVNVAPNDIGAQCGYSQSGGVAVGGSSLFLAVGGCPYFFEYSKTGVKLAWYPMSDVSPGDFECDDVSYAVDVIWMKSTWEGRIQAYELPAGSCAFGGGAASAPATNLLSNPGFESGGTGWYVHERATVDTTAANARSGNNSLKLVASAAWQGSSQDAMVSAGQTYTLSGWARSSSTGTFITLVGYNAIGAESGPHVDLTYPASDTWTEQTRSYTAPAGTVRVRIFLMSKVAGTFWFDDINLTSP